MRGLFLSGPVQPFMVLGVLALAIGWISFSARRALPA
jgi:hypothetical protein